MRNVKRLKGVNLLYNVENGKSCRMSNITKWIDFVKQLYTTA